MFRIKSNLDVNGRFWGLDFEHGEAFTERDDLARRLKSLGYAVEETVSAVANAVSGEQAPTAKEPAATTDAPAEAAREEPVEPAPYAGLGMAFLEMGQLEKALENYKLAARYSRGEVMHLQRVAEVQERLGLVSEAGKTYMAIGEIELNRKRLDDAMNNWHRAVRLEPDLLRAHQRLASIYQRQGAVRNAIQEYLAIARILQSQGENNKALQACNMALKLDPRNPDVLTAIEYIKQGELLFANERAAGTAPVANKSSGLLRMAVDLEKDVAAWEPDSGRGYVDVSSCGQTMLIAVWCRLQEEDAVQPPGVGMLVLPFVR